MFGKNKSTRESQRTVENCSNESRTNVESGSEMNERHGSRTNKSSRSKKSSNK